MGKAALLIVGATLVLGSMYAFGAKDEVRQADERLSTHQFEVLSRNAALAGYNVAKQELSENFTGAAAAMNGTYSGSTYNVAISRSSNIARVISRGISTMADGRQITFTVQADIERELISIIREEAPPFMRYALITQNNLGLDGNVLTDLYLEGNAANTLNANMHTNGSLFINGNSVVVRGFGTYVTTASSSPSTALLNSFRPYYNPTNAPVVQRVPTVDIPLFDAAEMADNVNVDNTTASVALSGTYDLGGTREDPYVWVVNGDLSASGGVTINGYTLFIVTGNASLAGNVQAGQTGYTGPDESSVALYTAGSVNLSGSARFYGQIFCGTTVTFSTGSPTVYGSVATRGGASFRGSPRIYYRVPSPALTTVFEDPEIRLNLISYSEY